MLIRQAELTHASDKFEFTTNLQRRNSELTKKFGAERRVPLRRLRSGGQSARSNLTSWDPREIWRQYGRENSAYNWISDNYRCYMCYLKVHLSARASWPVYYSTHADFESSRGGNVQKFVCLFFTLITIKCQRTWIDSILRIFGMYFNLMFNALKQIKYEKDLKSDYISDSIISQFTWISPELKKDRIRNIFTF